MDRQAMKRFFRAQRDEDYSQIQYLTAKCTRLAHDKVLEREFLVSREKERKLQNELDAVTTRLLHQEQLNLELRMNQDQLICRIRQQQNLVDVLQQRMVLLAEESRRDVELLQQVNSELVCLQSSEVQLEGLVEELHAEAQCRAALTDRLHAELRSKLVQLKELQETNDGLTEELRDLRKTHLEEVKELQQENKGSLSKLQETAEQFEWLCQQQKYWMRCVKRFKDCLMEERQTLLHQVSTLEKKVGQQKKSSHDGSPTQSLLRPLEEAERPGSVTSLDADVVTDLGSQVETSNMLYEELITQAGNPISRYQEPPCGLKPSHLLPLSSTQRF
ncbi:cingulin isoform X2 [Poecilia formosa]|uniref:cingulin isoform X2 n=1 Tax=Poecilia formosa TaxID=48698 RepID=UPI0007BA3FA4|nr:PREDICTED: cingulin-like isoform X2 [Poecilia formosa]